MKKSYYSVKQELVERLVATDKKHIKDSDIKKTADDLSIPFTVAKRAWNNFVETGGKIDKRQTNVSPKYLTQFGIPKLKRCSRSRTVSSAEAAKILLEYMTTKITTAELTNKYSISIHQLYSWTHELEVSGKLLGERILNPTKYSKPNVLAVMLYSRNPSSKSKRITSLTKNEKLNYERVKDILIEYLTALAEK